jgi:hypothetical protein
MCFFILAVEGGLSGPDDPAENSKLVGLGKVMAIPAAIELV